MDRWFPNIDTTTRQRRLKLLRLIFRRRWWVQIRGHIYVLRMPR